MTVFLSYAREDADEAGRVREALELAGQEVWQDVDLLPGDVWRDRVAAALHSASAVVVVLSPRSAGSKYVRRELQVAEASDRWIVPYVVPEVGGVRELQLRELRWSLAGRQLDCDGGREERLERLLAAVGLAGEGRLGWELAEHARDLALSWLQVADRERVVEPYRELRSLPGHRDRIPVQSDLLTWIAAESARARLASSEPARRFDPDGRTLRIQVPFQQIATAALLRSVADHLGGAAAGSGRRRGGLRQPPLRVDLRATSSIHLFKDVLGGRDENPAAICLNLFNAVELLSRSRRYVPLLMLPDAAQSTVLMDPSHTRLPRDASIFFHRRPYASLTMHFEALVARGVLPPDTRERDSFPDRMVELLTAPGALGESGQVFLIWHPLVVLLRWAEVVSARQLLPPPYHYPCVLMVRGDLREDPLIASLPALLREARDRLLDGTEAVASRLVELRYIERMRARFAL